MRNLRKTLITLRKIRSGEVCRHSKLNNPQDISIPSSAEVPANIEKAEE